MPAIEYASGMVWKREFNVGYSSERINPRDRKRTLTKIFKLVYGDTPETLQTVAQLYRPIVAAGVYRAGSIKVAELRNSEISDLVAEVANFDCDVIVHDLLASQRTLYTNTA